MSHLEVSQEEIVCLQNLLPLVQQYVQVLPGRAQRLSHFSIHLQAVAPLTLSWFCYDLCRHLSPRLLAGDEVVRLSQQLLDGRLLGPDVGHHSLVAIPQRGGLGERQPQSTGARTRLQQLQKRSGSSCAD